MRSLTIQRLDNGYLLTSPDCEGLGAGEWVIEDGPDGNDFINLSSGEALLWEVMDYFSFGGSKHDAERIRIVREPGENYDS